MAILRKNELKEMTGEELDDKLSQLQSDLMKIRGVLASGGIPENVGRIRETRKTIARIKTIKNTKARDEKDKKK
ncbi:MAG: 50S ribosomal protein L29 [Candidatus Altiarchaeota archaeon]|nr:50S ribosomal protein L29 [Candidatus Altiarchaeota archaeon]